MLKEQFVTYNNEEIALEVKKIDVCTYDIETINQAMSHEFGITIAKICFINAIFEQEQCINEALKIITNSIAEAIFNKEPDSTNKEDNDNSDISIHFLAENNEEHEKCKITFNYQVNKLYYDLFDITFGTAYNFQAKSTDKIIQKTIATLVAKITEMVNYHRNNKKLTMVATKIDYNDDYYILIRRSKFNNLHYFKISKTHKVEKIKTHISTIIIHDIYKDNIINAIMHTNITLIERILAALKI